MSSLQKLCQIYYRKHHLHLSKQSGVVIIIALFLVAMVAAMSFAMMSRLDRDTRRTSLVLHDIQAEFYAQGSLAWALDRLKSDWETRKNDRIVDQIPIRSPKDIVNGYQISSTIYDMQGRFNLNMLTNPEAQSDLQRLLDHALPQLKKDKSREIIRAIFNWITPSSTTNPQNKYYLQLAMPYRASGRPLVSISELKLIKGIKPDLYEQIKPYVSALPEIVPINIQTAPVPVLMALSPLFTKKDIQMIITTRKRKPFVSTQSFLDLEGIRDKKIATDKITAISSYFLVKTEVLIEKQHIVLYTLVKRSANEESQSKLSIIWQSKVI